jgi:hypothetical protein
MKAIMSKDGVLSFERTEGRIVKQYCPYREDTFCGDWCPLFSILDGSSPEGKVISLCKAQFSFDIEHFTDER